MDIRIIWDQPFTAPHNRTINLGYFADDTNLGLPKAVSAMLRHELADQLAEFHDNPNITGQTITVEYDEPVSGTLAVTRKGSITYRLAADTLRTDTFVAATNPPLRVNDEQTPVKVINPDAPAYGCWGYVSNEATDHDEIVVTLLDGGDVTYRRNELADKSHFVEFDNSDDSIAWANGDIRSQFSIGEYALYVAPDGSELVVQIDRMRCLPAHDDDQWTYQVHDVDKYASNRHLSGNLHKLPTNLQNLRIEPAKN